MRRAKGKEPLVVHLLSLVREIDEWVARRGGDVTELAEFTLDRFLEIFQFQAAWLLLMKGQQLKVVATDPQHAEDKGRLLRLDSSISGLAASKRQSIRIDDIERAEPYIKAIYQPVHGGGMRSDLAVPVMFEDRVIGVFNLESSEPAAFTPDDQELLEALARHLGVAIVAAEEMQQRAMLSEMAFEFSKSLAEEETAEAILNRASELIGGQFGQILTLEGEELEVKWATGGEGIGMRVRVDSCASGLALLGPGDPYLKSLLESGAVVLSSRSVIIPDVEKVERYVRVIEANKERMQSELAIPVILGGEVVGVFNVESPKPGAFTAEKEGALAEFVRRRAGEIGEALHRRATAELKELMQQGLRTVDEEFGQMLRLDGMELVIEHTGGDEPPGTRVGIEKLETGQWSPVTGRAVMEGGVINVPDVSEDPGYMRFLGEEMKSELVVPLIVRGEAIGVINLESPVPGYFTDEHVALLEPMASHAAAAMANAAAYKALDRAREVEKMAAVGELSGDLIHKLNSPLGAIRTRIGLIREKKARLLGEDSYLAGALDDIDRNAEKIVNMFRELRAKAGEAPKPVAVAPMLASALARVEAPENVEVVESYDDCLPDVRSGEKLVEVFYNLLTNALEAMPDGGTLEIRGRASEDGQWVDISILDTGRGIPNQLLEEIFEPYFSTKKGQGHGVGLWWSRAYIEKYGGRLEVESEMGRGSRFAVRLAALKRSPSEIQNATLAPGRSC